ncbi:MAG: hypothetical protein OHK0053_19030 [Microscillaceae bacterium]
MKTLLLYWASYKFLLVVVGFHLVLFLVCLVLIPFDKTQILGISRWIKPAKFALSIVVYLMTMAYLLSFFPASHWGRAQNYAFWFALLMLLVIICITIQALRGQPSHFNITSGFNIFIFNVMGLAILINTLMLVLLTIDFFVLPLEMPTDLRWAVRLGLGLMLLGSAEAGLMLRLQQHAVGVMDGGAGLPFLNWSTEGGDLRIAHFVGLHALQILISLVWLNAWFQFFTTDFAKIAGVCMASLLILGLFVVTAWQALAGKPLWH